MDPATLRTLVEHKDEGLPFRVSLEAVNRGVGLVALGLPVILLGLGLSGLVCNGTNSISHYYYSRLGGDVLVGMLSVIGVLLLFFYKLPPAPGDADGKVNVDGYLGHYKWDMRAARLAGLCALGVAFVPTRDPGCEDHATSVMRTFYTASGSDNAPSANFDFWHTFGIDGGLLTWTHYGAALGMFVVLAYFSLVVFTRPQSAAALTPSAEKRASKIRRNRAYQVCGGLIVLAIGALLYQFLVVRGDPDALARWNAQNLTFWFEALGLAAFGVSWSLKGRIFNRLRDPGEPDPKRKAAAQALRAA